MHKVSQSPPVVPSKGLIFYLGRLNHGIPDGPKGIWITDEFVKTNPLLREVKRENISFRFFAVDPLFGISEKAPIASLMALTKGALPGTTKYGSDVEISRYAEVENTTSLSQQLDEAIETGTESPELLEFAKSLLKHGYDAACELVNILRRDFAQYWLTPPNDFLGSQILLFYSSPRKEWYAIGGIEPEFFEEHLGVEYKREHSPRAVLLHMIDRQDVTTLQTAKSVSPYSFAEEMVATAMVELSQDRIRSAVIYGVIGLESAAQHAFKNLVATRLAGLEKGRVLDLIAKEVSLVNLARLTVEELTREGTSPGIDWDKISEAYNVRNTIVHMSRKKLPTFGKLRPMLLEIRKVVLWIESQSAS